MSARRRLLPLVPLVLGGLAVLAIVLAVRAVERPDPPRPAAAAVEASSSLSAQTVLFAEPVVARLALVVDASRVEPRRVRVGVDFRPFRLAGPVETTRKRTGDTVRVEYVYRLDCLDAACPPGAGERAVHFRPAVVEAGGRSARVPWPELTVASRLAAVRTPVAPERTAVSYRLPPRLLGWSLAGLAALLVVAAAAGLARRLAPAPHPRTDGDALDRALALVTSSAPGPASERRLALDRLALVLDQMRPGRVAGSTRTLAWSRGEPASDAIDDLVARVREEHAR